MSSINEKKAEKIYRKKLKIVEGIVGTKSTWLNQLDALGKKLFKNKFHGVYPSDEIPTLGRGQYCIVNVDKRGESGSHWIALAKYGSKLLFYDSFGRKGIKLIPMAGNGNGVVVDTDRDVEQDFLEENCGARCLAWIWVFDECGGKTASLI